MPYRQLNTRTQYQDDFSQEDDPAPSPGDDGTPVVDEITDIDSDLRSGTDGTLVTGTAGTNGNLAKWDANGDLIDAGLDATALHTQNTDTGTTATSWAVASGGTGFRLKNSSGQVQVRNLADSADGDLKVRNLTLTGEVTGLKLATDEGITLDEHASAPATPASGKVIVYAKADGKVYRKDDTGTEEELGGADGTGLANLVDDETPQWGGMMDQNGFAIGDGTREILKFGETPSAVNEVTITNAASGNAPTISATGDNTNIALNLVGKGTGKVTAGGLEVVTISGTQTLTGKSISADQINSGTLSPLRIGAGTIDNIAEIASGLKTGADSKLVTGTAGTDGNLLKWDANGDAVDSGIAVSDLGSGDVVGPASATTSVPALFDGTTGKLLKNSTPTGTGNPVLATSPTLVTPALGTPSSGTLTNCSGLPVSGIAASTSAALGVGSVEVGHASDTTIARASAGVISVEGNHVPSPASQAQGDVLYHNGTTWARLAAGTSGHFLKTLGTGANPAWAEATAAALSVAIYQDQKSSGTNGGSFTSGSWQTRTINTEVSDPDAVGTLASNQITLGAGTYFIKAEATAFGVARNQVRLYDITNTAVLATGVNTLSTASNMAAAAHVTWHGTLAGSTAIELQHRCETTVANTGFGVACSFDTEVYATITITKLA